MEFCAFKVLKKPCTNFFKFNWSSSLFNVKKITCYCGQSNLTLASFLSRKVATKAMDFVTQSLRSKLLSLLKKNIWKRWKNIFFLQPTLGPEHHPCHLTAAERSNINQGLNESHRDKTKITNVLLGFFLVSVGRPTVDTIETRNNIKKTLNFSVVK